MALTLNGETLHSFARSMSRDSNLASQGKPLPVPSRQMAMIAGNAQTRGRRALLWGLSWFISLQVLFGIAADYWLPGLRYPEYGRKLDMLTRLRAEKGRQPSLLALGTSRVVFGFRPAIDALGNRDADAWQFNFALTGQGPVQELICLHRLLATGFRPSRLLIEIHPALLHQAHPYMEPGLTDLGRLNWSDVSVLARYATDPRQVYINWIRSRIAPWHTHRRHVLGRVAPSMLTELQRTDLNLTRETDARGWSRFPVRPTDDENRRVMEKWSVGLYTEYFRGFEVSDAPRGAVEEMLCLCRREHIEPALLLMPECELFRKGYPHSAESVLNQWLNDVHDKCGIAVFDCRNWCTDDQFCDGHHMLPEGAEHFSARLELSLLQPWVAQSTARWAAEVARTPSFK
jgi:hypothetical protein